MKKAFTKICLMLAIVMIAASFGAFPVTYAEQTIAQDQTKAFIENVLPVNLSKYNITLTYHSTDEGPPITGVTGQPISRIVDNLRYTLNSDNSTLHVNFRVEDNVVVSCHIYVDNGQFISDRSYVDLTDAAKCFLEKYHTHTKIGSSNMTAMLDNVDVTKNSTKTIDNTTFSISNTDKYGIEQTSFKWTDTINGADYTSLQISYQNGNLHSIRDDRTVYTIGDTSIKISSEQAVDIAMKYLPNYAYNMPNEVIVSDFNITEDLTIAELTTSPIYSTELRPYWNVKLYLNQTYPGSVKGFSLYIWANSGEVFSCNNIAYGGIEPTDSSSIESTLSSAVDTSKSETSSSSPNMPFAVGIALATIGITTVSVAILKKRKK